MGNAFLYRMPSGIPGDISRKAHSTVESHYVTAQFAAYGIFGKLNASGNFAPLAAADTTASVYGLIVRSYPTQSASNPLGVALPAVNVIQDVMRRGYMTVKNNGGTAKKGGQVYVRVTNGTALKPIGGIEAVATAGETITVPAIFMHDADADGNVEISYNI